MQAFKQGFDATQSAAEGIFGTLNNGSIKSSGTKEDMADLSAGISILNTMAQASANVVLNDQLFPVSGTLPTGISVSTLAFAIPDKPLKPTDLRQSWHLMYTIIVFCTSLCLKILLSMV